MKKRIRQITVFLLAGMICTWPYMSALAVEDPEQGSPVQDETAEEPSEETDGQAQEEIVCDTDAAEAAAHPQEELPGEIAEDTPEGMPEEAQADAVPVGTEASSFSYRIIFDGNDAESGTLPEVELAYDVQKTLPPNAFLKTGYTFADWNTRKDGSGTAYKDKAAVKNLTEEPGGTVVLYAQWKANRYTVVFNGAGKTEGAMQKMVKLEYGQKYVLPANAYRKKGCTFQGWTDAKDGTGTEYADQAEFENLTAKNGAVVTFYAKWHEEPYTVSYMLDGGENNASNPDEYTVSKSVKLKKPAKAGYTFKGWYATGEFKKKVSGISKGSTGDKTFYAKWSLTRFKISYKLDGGKNSSANPAGYFYTSPVIVLDAPAKKGYDFEGWYTDAGYENRIEQIEEGSIGDVVLYARWSPIRYTVAFDAGGAVGTLPDPIECEYGKKYKTPWPDLVRTGYAFKGWYVNSGGSGTGYAPGKTIKNLTSQNGKTVTLYALWNKMSAAEESYAAEVVAIVNQNRKKQGLDSLTADPTLSAIAQERAYEISRSFSHTRPDGGSCFELFKAAGYQLLRGGENIAYGYASPDEVMAGWMNSTGHRANILKEDFTEIGVGCYSYNGRLYWVQCFGRPYGSEN